MKNKILIIDIETTGFLPKGKIVEIGVVELDVVTGEKLILYDKVIKPFGVDAETLQKSWIVEKGYMTVDAILAGGNIESAIQEVQEIINAYSNGVTAFNNAFDFKFLESEGLIFCKKLPCPMLLSTNICKFPGQYGNYKWPKVEEAHQFYFGDTGYTEKHRGADDAFHEADIVFELIKRGVFKI